jgi:glycosyltransferase involved in cell wall biosynthesis
LKRVLISAYTALPGSGSEAGVGWNWPVAASKHHEVWVITNTFHQREIEDHLRTNPNPNLHFVFQPSPAEHQLWRAARKFNALYYPAYLSWQIASLKRARELHGEVGFDVAHHLNWATNRFPTFLAWMDVPFIWGPVRGGETAPSRLYRSLGLRPAIGEIARDTSTYATKLDPLVRRTADRAKRILATSHQTMEALPANSLPKTEVYPAIGINPAELEMLCCEDVTLPAEARMHCEARLLFVGRLISWKGCALAIRALEHLVSGGLDAQLTIVGGGPEEPALRKLAVELGVGERVTFTQNLPRKAVMQLYRTHHMLLFPSLHDSGGAAVLEAMYFGMPVICLDLGGPAQSVGDTGVRVAPCSVRQIVTDIAAEARRLIEDPKRRQTLGQAARQRVLDHYDWEKKGAYIKELYEHTAAD